MIHISTDIILTMDTELNSNSFLEWARQFIAPDNPTEDAIQQLQTRRIEIRQHIRSLVQTLDERRRELLDINQQLAQLGESSLKMTRPRKSEPDPRPQPPSRPDAEAEAKPRRTKSTTEPKTRKSIVVPVIRPTSAAAAAAAAATVQQAPVESDDDSVSRVSARNGTYYDDLTVVHMKDFLKKKGYDKLSKMTKDALYGILQMNQLVRECYMARAQPK